MRSLSLNVPPGRRSRWRDGVRVASATVAAAALVLVGGASAMAGPGDSSNSSAQFLSGSLLAGIPVTTIAGLGGAAATNAGDPETDVDAVGLDVNALSAVNVTVPGGSASCR